jgi:hypothetical protein
MKISNEEKFTTLFKQHKNFNKFYEEKKDMHLMCDQKSSAKRVYYYSNSIKRY